MILLVFNYIVVVIIAVVFVLNDVVEIVVV